MFGYLDSRCIVLRMFTCCDAQSSEQRGAPCFLGGKLTNTPRCTSAPARIHTFPRPFIPATYLHTHTIPGHSLFYTAFLSRSFAFPPLTS